jgi:hypothetical protein
MTKNPTPGIEYFEAHCTRETEKALLCVINGEEVWIAKSQVHDDSEIEGEGDEGTLAIPTWLAEEKGLV